jgi:Cu2+-exporting ATPase
MNGSKSTNKTQQNLDTDNMTGTSDSQQNVMSVSGSMEHSSHTLHQDHATSHHMDEAHHGHDGHHTHEDNSEHPAHENHAGHQAHEEHAEHPEHEGHTGHSEHEGHGAHVDHTGHELMFRNRFWVCLVLSIPVLLYSPALQEWFNYSMPVFPGSQFITPVFSIIVFIIGGVPFLRMAIPEFRNRRPGIWL